MEQYLKLKIYIGNMNYNNYKHISVDISKYITNNVVMELFSDMDNFIFDMKNHIVNNLSNRNLLFKPSLKIKHDIDKIIDDLHYFYKNNIILSEINYINKYDIYINIIYFIFILNNIFKLLSYNKLMDNYIDRFIKILEKFIKRTEFYNDKQLYEYFLNNIFHEKYHPIIDKKYLNKIINFKIKQKMVNYI